MVRPLSEYTGGASGEPNEKRGVSFADLSNATDRALE